jgi:F0F1-type ATP synthase membrane subunit b/b'
MNTVTSIVMASAMAALLVTAPLHADEADFDPAKMLSDLEQQLRMTREQYEKARPEMEKAMQEKSRELKASIDRQVDEGYLQLEAMSKEMSQASERLKKDLEQSLNSEQVQELKAYLEGLDRQAVEDATRKLLDELTVLLALTASQIEELKPVLRDYLDRASALLQEFIRDSSRTFEEYRREYEAAADELRDQLNDTLDSMQMEKLDRRLDEIKEKVHDQVFINT